MTLALRRTLCACVAGVLLAGCGSSAHRAARTSGSTTTTQEPSYGALPTFLPSATLRPDSELTGAAARPAVTTEGDAVRVVVANGSVRITVTGPVVPVEGAASEPDTTTCTWTVTLTSARGQIPISVSAFTVLDEEGHQIRPHLAPGSPRPPTAIGPGRSARFELRAVMSAGEGVVRWAPEGHVVASWDFVAETD